jgi:4-hydroxy-2-oxoglutarate aldolase
LRRDDETTQQQPSNKFSTRNLHGVLLPLTTPFVENGGIDTAAVRSNIQKWSETGVAGCVVLGSTGERVHLDEREYLELIETARAEVASGPEPLAFIVGAGQQSTRGTINEIKIAADAGADAVLVITPHYYRSSITQDVLIEHYTAVADASPARVILYSMPALTGIKIEPETAARLSEHQNIIGIKDSSSDVEGIKRTVDLVRASRSGEGSSARDDFAVLTGNGTVLCDALRAGADGAILAVGCVVPQLCVEIFRAVEAGENERPASLQEKLSPLAHAVTTKHGIGGLKAALDMVGYVGGTVRAPLRMPGEEARREIARLLREAQAVMAEHPIDAELAAASSFGEFDKT